MGKSGPENLEVIRVTFFFLKNYGMLFETVNGRRFESLMGGNSCATANQAALQNVISVAFPVVVPASVML